MKLKVRTNKVWVVYAYDPTTNMWDEINHSIHYRQLRYIFRKNFMSQSMKDHGYTKFVLVRRHISSLWEYNKNTYTKFFTSDKVRDLLRRLAKYERTVTHTNR